jgi:hypothetical protein
MSFEYQLNGRFEFITQAMRQRCYGGGFDFQDTAAHGKGKITPVSS